MSANVILLHPDQTRHPWHTPRDHQQLLEEGTGVAELLGLAAVPQAYGVPAGDSIDPYAPFFVECAFLEYWNDQLCDRPNQEGFEDLDVYINEDGEAIIEIKFYDRIASSEYSHDQIIMCYTPDPDHPGRHALEIIRNDNLIYQRTASQDPATEWLINEMADDPEIIDADGHPLFTGDPCNI